MDERMHLIHHSWIPADIVSVENLTLVAMLFAMSQLCHPFEGPSTAVYCCNSIGGGVDVFGVATSCWLLNILIFDPHERCLSFSKIFLWEKTMVEDENSILYSQISCDLLSSDVVCCWLHIFHQLYVGCCIFIIFWFDDVNVGRHFSSLTIMNPLLCVTPCVLLSVTFHNTAHPISYYGDWEGDVAVIVAFVGSCSDIDIIIGRSMNQHCKKIELAWLKIFSLSIGTSPVSWTCFVPSLMSWTILRSWGVVEMMGGKGFYWTIMWCH